MSTASMREIKRGLWEADRHCHWCGRLTYWHAGERKNQRANDATLDHLYSKLDPQRHATPGQPHEYVLACYRCNGLRSHKENRALSPEEKRRRSWGHAGELYREVPQTCDMPRQCSDADRSPVTPTGPARTCSNVFTRTAQEHGA